MHPGIWIAVPALLLAACGEKADAPAGDVPEVTINAKGEGGGAVQINANAETSSISIDGDGVKINADLPGIDGMDINKDFEINGVKLYPGAKITSINVNADSRLPEGQQGRVEFGMTAPAAPDVVLNWYAKAFSAKGIATTTKGSMLSGKTADGEVFAIELNPDGKGAKGVVRISG